MKIIDINCDVGEGIANEHLIMPYISSCNIACGGHFGDVKSIDKTIELAINNNVKIGVHPSFPDKENFGRKLMQISDVDLKNSIQSQLNLFIERLSLLDGKLHHIKPHGALYNAIAVDEKLAILFINSVQKYLKNAFLYVPYNSVIENVALKNNIKIKYTGISYKDFGNLVYQYKFENDKTWTTTTNRQLDFKDLPNGNYSLKIKAKSNNTFSDIKHLNFTITPPFWKTFYFVSICIILSILVLYFIVKQRIKKINSHFELERKSFKIQQEKILLEKQMVELKQKALRLQMNPHFIFNALNTIKGYYSGGEIVAANTYISKFSRLLRLILESDEHHISIDKEVETLKLYIKLVQLRYQDTFDYKIEIAENIIAEQIAIPPLLIQPIVENAIIHGLIPKEKKGLIDIKFYAEKSILICVVKDNGVGFSADDKKSIHKSKALKITKDRVDFENYSSIKTNIQIIHHKNPKGTEVIIKIPLQNIISKK